MMSHEKEIAAQIGFFYYEKAEGSESDKIHKATNDIHMLDIISIRYENEHAVISLTRPGLLIGLRGSNIDALTKYLQANVKNPNPFPIKGILIEEFKRPSHLYCFRAVYDMNDDFDCDFDTAMEDIP